MRCAQSCYEEVGGDGIALAGNATVYFSGLRMDMIQCGAKSLGIKQMFAFHLRPRINATSISKQDQYLNAEELATGDVDMIYNHMYIDICYIYIYVMQPSMIIYMDPSMHLWWAMRRNIACTNC